MQSTLHLFNVEHKTNSNRARSTSAACESNILSTVLSKIEVTGRIRKCLFEGKSTYTGDLPKPRSNVFGEYDALQTDVTLGRGFAGV